MWTYRLTRKKNPEPDDLNPYKCSIIAHNGSHHWYLGEWTTQAAADNILESFKLNIDNDDRFSIEYDKDGLPYGILKSSNGYIIGYTYSWVTENSVREVLKSSRKYKDRIKTKVVEVSS